MTFQGDPYRTLGVAPGASLNEIRSAYRRLAKTYHPDAAGERALPRFLAIQAAYERLVDADGRLRPPGSWGSDGSRPAGTPSRADPARARASRDAWRARRTAGGPAGGGAADAAGSGTAGAAGRERRTGQGRGSASGGAGSGASGPGGADRHHHRRGPRKATPGSTTYDEAATPLDPDWDGGAWYGPSSGTYWTINPREYADPRKHGPEYLARARWRGMDATGADATGPDTTATDGGAEWGTRAWTFDDRADAGPTWAPRADAGARRTGPVAPGASGGPAAADPATAPAPMPDIESLARRADPANLLALARRPGRRWRLVIAGIAWPPIGYALGTLLAVITGCASFSASCPEHLPTVLLLAQPLVLAGLYAVPVVAAASAFATIVAIVVAVPAAAVLSVGSLPRTEVEATVLGALVVVVYLLAFAGAVARLWNGPGSQDPGP